MVWLITFHFRPSLPIKGYVTPFSQYEKNNLLLGRFGIRLTIQYIEGQLLIVFGLALD